MTPPPHPLGVADLIDRSVTRLTVLLGALKTIQDHHALLGPVVSDAILRSAIRHGLELQSLMDEARVEAGSSS